MQITHRDRVKPFTTKDKSEIREFFHSQNMSIAEATVRAGQITDLVGK